MNKRVVITGMGAVTPVGNTLTEFWSSLKSGKSGIDYISSFDTEDFPAKIAAEVKDFDVSEYVNKKEGRRLDRFCQLGIAAAMQAWVDSNLEENRPDEYRAGVIFGSGIGGLQTIHREVLKMENSGPQRISPFFIPMSIINMAAGYIALKLNLKGVNYSVQTACATGNTAIGEAFDKIRAGAADVILAGGTEGTVIPIAMAGFASMKAIYMGDDPNRASIPFDLERSGFVFGEGAGALILESLENAQKRGAKIYGEIVGYGSTADAYHITAPSPEAEGATMAMKLALKSAGIGPQAVGYINAHGTSTPLNDKLETLAIKQAFGEHAQNIPISSTKSMTGHLLGAAGAIESIACIMALKEGVLPPTINLQVADPECDLDYIPNQSRACKIDYALNNSLGFGGHNVSLIFKRWVE